ncbi:MAG TPA: phosphatidate cytidylyltransferase [Candidatus Acidoferrum sp.]
MTLTRVLTALVLMPAVIVIVLFTSTAVVAVALALITVLALWEYFALGDAIGHRAYRLWTIFCSLLLLYIQYQATAANHNRQVVDLLLFGPDHFPRHEAPFALLVFFVFVLGLTALTLWGHRPLVESLPAAGISSSALLLVAFPLSFAVRLHAIPAFGPRLLLFALALIWASDTLAYFAGRSFGKYPLAPHISPKKTWEGSIAGMFGSLLIALAFHLWLTIPLPHLFAMATVGNVAGQMGDLLESACKRSAGVKDSGGLLPGHGGVLDRIDALILCIPAIWYYLVLVNPSL